MAKREHGSENGRLKRKEYEKEMDRLHAELCTKHAPWYIVRSDDR